MPFWQILSIALIGMAAVGFLLWGLATIAAWSLPPLLFVTAVLLILLVLVQRGKGGGLAGAFGGLGGQSAFGTKAGDLFTKVTIVVAAFWIVLCIVTVKFTGVSSSKRPEEGLGTKAQDRSGMAAPVSGDEGSTKSGQKSEDSS